MTKVWNWCKRHARTLLIVALACALAYIGLRYAGMAR
jgi:hypothetical protein